MLTTNDRSLRAQNHLPTGCKRATSKTDHAQKLQISPPGFCFSRRVTATTQLHHLDVPLQSFGHRQPGLYQKTTMHHHEMFLQGTTCLRVFLPPLLLLIRPPALPRFSTYPPRMHETWTAHPADHRPRQQWPKEFRSESSASERSPTPPLTCSRRSLSPRRRSPSPYQLRN
ncbi:hypothetical protein HPB51_022568 [Rhipicephalus microplus]|uniref:Uncharacterized protein n=1 Tax=Rhipicephalus microplus TaxID=6941 RepID=A0A9J6DCX0_RHIMP|nr:hypothetical protein HPB51_022568 [Rhipicephalus microplus]